MADIETEQLGVLDVIWAGDNLRRRAEARRLERYLISETEAFAEQDREQAIVLALDAQYGEGKSWFLQRFTKQLELNHPVAFVDAWIDDASNEPLVSIMAALEECLTPFLQTTALKEKMAGLARAAWPIMGKAVVGAAGKFVGKYIGEQFGEDAKEILAQAKAKEKSAGEEAAGAAVDALASGVSQVVDAAGKAMLDQYRQRQKSREAFKGNLKAIAAGLSAVQAGEKQGPIFIVVDELDRCRPNYAIALLEDIKHLFDVPGVVFVIALHSGQLRESVKAIYGEGFDGADYLRRFFTRHYTLRRLLISELVASHFKWVAKPGVRLEAPCISDGKRQVDVDPVLLTGLLLSEWGATPREALRILDGLRLFISDWDSHLPVELPLLLGMLFHFVRDGAASFASPQLVKRYVSFALFNQQQGIFEEASSSDLFPAYEKAATADLRDSMGHNQSKKGHLYAFERMREEFNARHGGKPISSGVALPSTWSEYPERVESVGRFLETDQEGET